MPNVLARGIAAAAAFAALVAAGHALGGSSASTTYSAGFEYGGTISFERVKGSRGQKVRKIEIEGIVADCAGRAGLLDFSILGTTTVLDDRSFAVRSEDGTGGKAVVRAEFSRRFRRAKGAARVYGRFQFTDGWSKCESGKQRFTARVAGRLRGAG